MVLKFRGDIMKSQKTKAKEVLEFIRAMILEGSPPESILKFINNTPHKERMDISHDASMILAFYEDGAVSYTSVFNKTALFLYKDLDLK
jgi:hypothetical protein